MKTLRALSSKYASDQVLFYLTPERALSRAGRLTLNEWELKRSQGRAQINPPVLALADLARKILRFQEQCEQQWLRPTRRLSELEIISVLRHIDSELGPREALEELRYIEIFEKFGLSPADWREVIEGLEEHRESEPDFGEWSTRILRYLRCKSRVEGMDPPALLSLWEQIALASHELQQRPPSFWNWSRILNVAGDGQSAHMFFVQNCELFPAEKNFLDALIRAQAPVEIADFTQAIYELSDNEISALPQRPMRPGQPLVWGLFSESPGSATWTQTLSNDVPLDVPLLRERGASPLSRALRLWAQFFSESEPRFHDFRQNPAHRLLLTKLGCDCAHAPTVLDVVTCLQSEKNFLRPELLTLTADGASVIEWLDVLVATGYFESDPGRMDRLSRSQLDAQGDRIYALSDLSIGFDGEILFFARPSELHEILSEKSLEWANERLLPHRISRLFERAGFRVPEPNREAAIHRALVGAFKDQIALVKVASTQDEAEAPEPVFQSTAKRGHHSASSFELLLQCPYRYFARHHLKIQSQRESDPIRIDPLAQGNWLHFALEHFFKSPDWQDPVALVTQALIEKLDEAFEENSSAEYREFLRRQVPNFAGRLGRHLQLFEKPLFDLAAPTRILTEFSFQTQYMGQEFWGRIDRLDLLPDGRALLWDYKTGGSFQGTPANLIRKGKIQWFLYKEILEQKSRELGLGDTLQVAGGGFLNPLDPSRSQAYFFNDRLPRSLLDFQAAAYALRFIPSKEDNDIRTLLQFQLNVIAERLASNEYRPQPLEDSLCGHCDALSACGRPYLSEERA